MEDSGKRRARLAASLLRFRCVYGEEAGGKLRYMHRNPVVRALVLAPEQWNWSSYRHYALGERGPVLVNEAQKAEMRVRGIA